MRSPAALLYFTVSEIERSRSYIWSPMKYIWERVQIEPILLNTDSKSHMGNWSNSTTRFDLEWPWKDKLQMQGYLYIAPLFESSHRKALNRLKWKPFMYTSAVIIFLLRVSPFSQLRKITPVFNQFKKTNVNLEWIMHMYVSSSALSCALDIPLLHLQWLSRVDRAIPWACSCHGTLFALFWKQKYGRSYTTNLYMMIANALVVFHKALHACYRNTTVKPPFSKAIFSLSEKKSFLLFSGHLPTLVWSAPRK